MKNTYRREKDGEIIIGQSLPVFIHNYHYMLSEIHIYKDGMIDCWELTDLNGFIEKVRSGWIKTSIPDNHDLYAFPLGNFKIEKFFPGRSEEELIKEVKDILAILNNRPTSLNLCREAFQTYQSNPSKEHFNKLKESYELVPNHNKKFILGDMDVDDIPIRVILFGEDEYEKSHKGQVQRQLIKEHYLKGL